MASRINADSSNGLQLVSDSSGEVQFQSSGITKATLNSSGLSSPGHVLQVVHSSLSTEVSSSSSTQVTTGLEATITPSSTSSKILIMVNFGKIDINENGEIRLTELAKKPVEIIDHRNQNVYRIIFIYDTNEIKIEVNGVPLLTNCPVSTKAIHYYGYLVKGRLVQFEKMRFNGE